MFEVQLTIPGHREPFDLMVVSHDRAFCLTDGLLHMGSCLMCLKHLSDTMYIPRQRQTSSLGSGRFKRLKSYIHVD